MVIWNIGIIPLSRVSLAEFILSLSKGCGYDIPYGGEGMYM